MSCFLVRWLEFDLKNLLTDKPSDNPHFQAEKISKQCKRLAEKQRTDWKCFMLRKSGSCLAFSIRGLKMMFMSLFIWLFETTSDNSRFLFPCFETRLNPSLDIVSWRFLAFKFYLNLTVFLKLFLSGYGESKTISSLFFSSVGFLGFEKKRREKASLVPLGSTTRR